MKTYIVTNPEGKSYTVEAVDMHNAKNMCQPRDAFKYRAKEYKCKLVEKK